MQSAAFYIPKLAVYVLLMNNILFIKLANISYFTNFVIHYCSVR